MNCTARLGLPFLSPGQAQKEQFHNEALQILDAIVAPTVGECPRIDPPAKPSPGDCFIVGAGAVGAWSGRDGALTCYTEGGWRYLDAPLGTEVFVRSEGLFALRREEGWEIGITRCSAVKVNGDQILGAQCGPIASPTGGKTIDKEARSVLGEVLAALRSHGLIKT